ncbi:MAG: helix-turn-helix transcriptional regulator [Chitinophagaceae bacterium]|nr:helix-turn-helix transcriptional regulator [Chitinophagaceae bacterium]
MNKNHEILKKIDSGKRSSWLEARAKKRSHKKARENARLVAIRVLTILRERNMSQTELAEKMSVSRQQVTKIVKGQENFTFETIDKLETALGVTLMTIAAPEPAFEYGEVHLKGTISLSAEQLSGSRPIRMAYAYSNMSVIKVFTAKSTKSKLKFFFVPKGSIDNIQNSALIQMS